jgi:hypothetical protein
MPFQAGDKIRNRRTGEIATVSYFNPACGNVYIGEQRQEIATAQWDRVVEPPPATREPQPVGSNGNGHATVPPLSAFEREKERVG